MSLCGSPGFSAEKFQHIIEEKKIQLCCTGEGRRNCLTLPALPLQGSTAQHQERTSYSTISPMGEK